MQTGMGIDIAPLHCVTSFQQKDLGIKLRSFCVYGIRSSSVRFSAAARGRILTRGTGLRPDSH